MHYQKHNFIAKLVSKITYFIILITANNRISQIFFWIKRMNLIYEKLRFSLKWLTLESLGYQAILLAHQLALFRASGFQLYGAIGAIFSVIYLAVTIASFGLESSLSPFFAEIRKNKNRFKSFFIHQIALSIGIVILIFFFFLIIKIMGSNNTFIASFSYPFVFLTAILILCESIKKTLRGIMYLAFKNKANTYVEMFYILSYVITVWIIYLATNAITINAIFIPMLASSAISGAILLFFVYTFYQSLPKTSETLSINTHIRILKCRAFNFINQLTHNMFSSNFLVPFFAMQFGLEMAGVFKLLSHITYSLTALMRKIFGWTSDTILAHTKHMTNATKQLAFSSINQKLTNILLGIGIFFMFNMGKIMTYSKCSTALVNWPMMTLFVVITLSENLFITYEKFYIAEEKIQHIFLFNLLSIIALLGIVKTCSHFSQVTIMATIACTRILFFITLSLLSFYLWHIKPRMAIKPLHVVGYSLLAFIFSKFL